jgi:hypothetical protein
VRPEVAAVLEHAASKVGVAELPPHLNRGPEVDAWNKRVGNDQAAPWCAAFAWCMGADELEADWPVVKTGSCQAIYTWAKKEKLLRDEPEPGDLFLMYHPELSRYAHVGYVRTVRSDELDTVEGNTNTNGSREGWGVFAKTRARTPRLAFVRWADATE